LQGNKHIYWHIAMTVYATFTPLYIATWGGFFFLIVEGMVIFLFFIYFTYPHKGREGEEKFELVIFTSLGVIPACTKNSSCNSPKKKKKKLM
jgi:hypothetical protein